MPSPCHQPSPPDPARAPFRLLAKAGETVALAGGVLARCPYADHDPRSAPWRDGWWQGLIARHRAVGLSARDERHGRRANVTKKKEPRPHPDTVGPCRVCGAPIPWDPAKSVYQNLNTHYCGDEHKLVWRRGVRASRSARERAEVAAGTRQRRPGGAGGKSVPDRCDELAARLGAYWAALGYDVNPRVEVMPLDDGTPPSAHGMRNVRRVVSDLVGGLPPHTTWDEVRRRQLALAARTDAAKGRG